jgi:hypothetical protein
MTICLEFSEYDRNRPSRVPAYLPTYSLFTSGMSF